MRGAATATATAVSTAEAQRTRSGLMGELRRKPREEPRAELREKPRGIPRRRSAVVAVTTPLVVLCVLCVSEVSLAVAQGSVRPTQPTQQRRRTLDIRATAPAPEVVTIRPREIPAFDRALLAPAMLRPPQNTAPRTVVIFPGFLTAAGAPAQAPGPRRPGDYSPTQPQPDRPK
jgi:hypothetical protein